MSGTPYIRFFSDDWIAGTQHLDLTERGVLITIVALTASTGVPPLADYKRLARRFGCTSAKARKSVAALVDLGKLRIVDGHIVNGRALKEVGISQKLCEKQSENASARWAKKEEKGNKIKVSDDATALPPHMPEVCQPEPEPEPLKKEDTNVSLLDTAQAFDEIAQAVEAYNEASMRTGWPKVQIISPARRTAVRARIKDAGGMEGWGIAISKAEASSFLTGRTDRPFTASFDFIIKQENFTKIMEGNYDDRTSAPRTADQNRGPSGYTQAGGRGPDASIASIVARRRIERGQ